MSFLLKLFLIFLSLAIAFLYAAVMIVIEKKLAKQYKEMTEKKCPPHKWKISKTAKKINCTLCKQEPNQLSKKESYKDSDDWN